MWGRQGGGRRGVGGKEGMELMFGKRQGKQWPVDISLSCKVHGRLLYLLTYSLARHGLLHCQAAPSPFADPIVLWENHTQLRKHPKLCLSFIVKYTEECSLSLSLSLTLALSLSPALPLSLSLFSPPLPPSLVQNAQKVALEGLLSSQPQGASGVNASSALNQNEKGVKETWSKWTRLFVRINAVLYSNSR